MSDAIMFIEGDSCPACEDGDIGYDDVIDCHCHINPPCGNCTDNPLVCLVCGEDPYDHLGVKDE